MTQLQKLIIGINLIILMVYTIPFYREAPQHLAILVHAIVIAWHLSALIFMAIIAHFLKKKELQKGLGLSVGVILLIGFGTCVYINN